MSSPCRARRTRNFSSPPRLSGALNFDTSRNCLFSRARTVSSAPSEECAISSRSHRAPSARGGPRSCRPEMLVRRRARMIRGRRHLYVLRWQRNACVVRRVSKAHRQGLLDALMLSHMLTLYRGDETRTLLMNLLRACRVSPQGGRVAARRVAAGRVAANRSSRERDVEPTRRP